MGSWGCDIQLTVDSAAGTELEKVTTVASRGSSKQEQSAGSWHESRDEIPSARKRAERITNTSLYACIFRGYRQEIR
jgi:hypothetical protein